MQTEANPTPVRASATQVGEAEARRRRWAWAEPCVWTDRMLAALENGVQGGMWFSLIDKVYRGENLAAAYKAVARNAGAGGVDHVTVRQYGKNMADENIALSEALRAGTYEPQAARRVYIDKPGTTEKRPLGIPTVRDRVCEGALRHVLEPIFEREFADNSYGFRPGRSAKDALRRVDSELKAGKGYVVDADLKRYFDTIPHARLLDRVGERIADGRVLELLRRMLKRGVLEAREWQATETGTPQGGVISPLLANVYLNALDHQMQRAGFTMIRYADDLVILCATAAEADVAHAMLRDWVQINGIALNLEKTGIVNMHEAGAGFDFLGYHFARTRRGKLDRWPRRKSLAKLKATLREQTHRANGKSLQATIQTVNRTTQSWFAYFKHSNRWTFRDLDQWVRGRLRAILRHRAHRRGRARGYDHCQWTNAFFAKHGYFSLYEAHAIACRSARR